MKSPPSTLIDAHGRLTHSTVAFLHEHFGFSKDTLQNTLYKQIPFHKNAITLFNHVFYDAKCLKKTEAEWLLLIIHEQVHREEIGNRFLKATKWYAGYLAGFISAGFSYRNNPYEERAYAIEFGAIEKLKKII